MEPLAFLTTTSSLALHVPTAAGGSLSLSPITAGVFAGIFWSVLAVVIFRRSTPYRWYGLMVGYAACATLANAFVARFGEPDLSPPVAFATAVFAGAGIGVHLAAPIFASMRPLHETARPAGGFILIGAPLLLTPLAYVSELVPFSAFLLGSAVLGLPAALFCINAGICLQVVHKPGTALAVAALCVTPELLLAGILPPALRAL